VVGGLFGVSMLGMAAMSLGGNQGSKKAEVDAKRREYLRYLSQARRQARKAADQQRAALLWRHPPPSTLWSVPAAGRMWERRPGDNDFGEVRVATGGQKLAITIAPPQTRPIEDLEPLTAIALRRFVHAHSAVPDLPLAIQLRAFSRVVLRGDRADVLGLVRSMLCQLATFHSPDDAVVAVVAAPELAAEWDWVKWLPHAQSTRAADAVGPMRLVSTSLDDLGALLPPDLSDRPRFGADERAATPHILLVIDGGHLPPGNHIVPPDGLHGVTLLDLPSRWDELEDSTRLRANRATGWPVAAWFSRLRPDPLKRLHLDLGSSGKELSGRARTSVPSPTTVQRARVDSAVRTLADDVSSDLSRSWSQAVREASLSRHDDLNDGLDRALGATELGAARIPAWAGLVRVLQWLLLLAALAGAAWLGAMFATRYLTFEMPATPEVGGYPLPLLLLVGGVVLGILFALFCRLLVRATARRRARAADRRLRAAIAEVADELVVKPVQDVLAGYDTARRGIDQALQ